MSEQKERKANNAKQMKYRAKRVSDMSNHNIQRLDTFEVKKKN